MSATVMGRGRLRELRFVLWELLRADRLLDAPPFRGFDRGYHDEVLERALAFAREIGASADADDREGCSLGPDGRVRIPASFERLWPRWRAWADLGTPVAAADGPAAESQLPAPVKQAVMELLMGANPAFMCFGGFTAPAARLVREHGTDLQKRLFLERLEGWWWDACYCATEADAGSDLLAMRSAATEIEGEPGVWAIEGEKRYITAGRHELTENTLYVVLARVAPARADSMFLSCFLVPRYWIDPVTGERSDNHVACVAVPDKMGLRACPNTHLRFGTGGPTRALLLGDRRNAGLLQFTALARQARVNTGIFGVGLAAQACADSVAYARTRVQGKRLADASNAGADRVSIVEHADVQRMLLDMKARTEAARVLIGRVAMLSAEGLAEAPDAESQAERRRLAALLVPIVKTWCAEQCARVCDTAIQVHGGIGYTDATSVGRYARDARVLSIWEGTSYVQALLLVRDALAFGRNRAQWQALRAAVLGTLAQRPMPAELQPQHAALLRALDDCAAVLERVREALEQRRLEPMATQFVRIAEMFGHTLGAWSLLEAAQVAAAALPQAGSDDERAFYRGKLKAARHFFDCVLPEVAHARALVDAAAGEGLAASADELALLDEEAIA